MGYDRKEITKNISDAVRKDLGDVFSVRDTAKMLDMSSSRVHGLISEGRITAQKVNGISFVKKTDIDELKKIKDQFGMIPKVTKGKRKQKEVEIASDDKISGKDAMEILGITISGVQHLIHSGKVDAQKMGKNWYLSRKSVMAYANTRAASVAKSDSIVVVLDRDVKAAFQSMAKLVYKKSAEDFLCSFVNEKVKEMVGTADVEIKQTIKASKR